MIIAPASFVTWATMRPLILAHARECPSFLLDDAMKEAAKEFFAYSRVWRSEHDLLLTTVADTKEYAYTPPSNAEVVAVQTAWLGEEELEEAHPGDRNREKPTQACSYPRIGVRPTNVLYLTENPQVIGDIEGTLSFKPSADATGIPIEAWTQWKMGLACGAAARLVIEPEKPWSNPKAYQFLQGKFDEATRLAAMSAGPTRRRSLRSEAV